MKYFVVVFIFLGFLPLKAEAGNWRCDASGFSIQEKKPREYTIYNSNETLIKYSFRGFLDMPSPGYTYKLSTVQDTSIVTDLLVLHLKGPGAGVTAAAVITSLEIKEEFNISPFTNRLIIGIDKGFNWGPDKITCELIES